jgi:hypothetical protein
MYTSPARADARSTDLDPVHRIYLDNLTGRLDELALTLEYAERFAAPAVTTWDELLALRARIRHVRVVAALLGEWDLRAAQATAASAAERNEWRLHADAKRTEDDARPGYYEKERRRLRRQRRPLGRCGRCGELARDLVPVTRPNGRVDLMTRYCARRLAGDVPRRAVHPDQLCLVGGS